MKRSYLRNNVDPEERDNNNTSGNTPRRQSRFSFYPIFSAISGGNHNNNNTSNNNNTMTNNNPGKGNTSSSKNKGGIIIEDTSSISFSSTTKPVSTLETTQQIHSVPLSDVAEEKIDESFVCGGSPTKILLKQEEIPSYPPPTPPLLVAFHVEEEEEDSAANNNNNKTSGLKMTINHENQHMDTWNLHSQQLHESPSSSLLSLSQHSESTSSMGNNIHKNHYNEDGEEQDNESMTGLEPYDDTHEGELEKMIETTTTTRRSNMESLFIFDNSTTTAPAPADTPTTNRTVIKEDNGLKIQDSQQIIQQNNKMEKEQSILQESLNYLQQRRWKREPKTIITTTTNQVESTTSKMNPMTKIILNNILIAPPPLYPPSNKILSSHHPNHQTVYGTLKSSESNNKTTNNNTILSSTCQPTTVASTPPPPIVSASKMDDCLLSPFVDVRQSVTSSKPGMFRNTTKKDMMTSIELSSSSSSSVQNNNTNKSTSFISMQEDGSTKDTNNHGEEEEDSEMDLSYLRHLQLAHPIQSQQPSSTQSSPYSFTKEVKPSEENEVQEEVVVPTTTTHYTSSSSLFPITPPRILHDNVVSSNHPESELSKSSSNKTSGWVQFTNEDSLNPFSEQPVQLSPWNYTSQKTTPLLVDKRFLEEKVEQFLESILISILERSTTSSSLRKISLDHNIDDNNNIPTTNKDIIITTSPPSMGEIIEKSISTFLQEYSTTADFFVENKDLIHDESKVTSSPPSLTKKSEEKEEEENPVTSSSVKSSYNTTTDTGDGNEYSYNTTADTGDGNEYSDVSSHFLEHDIKNRDDDISDSNAIFDRDLSILSDEDDDERNISYDDHAVDERGVESHTKVLGRLSSIMGGTTGVVLHDEEILDEYDDDDLISQQLYDIEHRFEVSRENDAVDSFEHYIRDSIELSKESPDVSSDSVYSDEVHNPDRSDQRSLLPDTIETLSTNMCKNPAAIMSAFSFDSFKKSNMKKDSKVVDTPLSLSFDDKDNLTDSSMVRRLYGHLLPEVMKNDKKKSGLSSWLGGKFCDNALYSEPWDNSDPDETGFIKHKISQAQLQYLEAEYKRLVQRYPSTPSPSSDSNRRRPSLNQNSVTTEDAEIAVSAVEDQPDTDEDVTDFKRSSADVNKATPRRSPDDSPRRTSRLIHSLQTNPAFPSAKAAGTGNVGDLEIYHLPIIYKAHQTGFEPTKDLVLQPGTIFAGQYYVQSELGGAAFSMTYRCIDMNSGKTGPDGEEYYEEVCLKVIKNNKDFFDQSLDEIKILELLRQTGKCHEHNIVEMKCFFYHKEHLVIVTELLRQNLFEFGKYIAENNEPQYFTRTRLCYIARQCLVSLNFIHKLGLVHSDIKPENILLSSYSKARVKVIDFGSSCYLTDRQSSYIQSRSYRAPEVVLGLPYDGKIDIWSLGCVIAEMYTGQVTFQNESVVSMLSRIESICGIFPRHMIESGRVSNQFFTPNGLLFEKINNEQDSVDDISVDMDEVFFNVFQPKITTLSSRLGLEAGLLERRRTNWEDEEKALFVDFIRKLLSVDPDHRPTAAQALEHPWILSGFNISEDDLIYPPAK